MVELTDSLQCLYTGTVEQRSDDEYVVHVPETEVEHGTVDEGESYRVVLLKQNQSSDDAVAEPPEKDGTHHNTSEASAGPPVEEGDVRDVTIETLGDQGDGIAKIERGYVVIVPDSDIGDELTVEITTVRENVAFAE